MSEATSAPLRIKQIRVEGLFGLYDHCINMNLEERVTILHGPNGVGKTVTLKMLDDLFEGRHDFIKRVFFKLFCVIFTDGTNISIQQADNEEAITLTLKSGTGESLLSQNLGKRSPSNHTTSTTLELLRQSDLFAQEEDDDDLSNGKEKFEDLPYRKIINISSFGMRRHRYMQSNSWKREYIIKDFNTHFVETQRLLRATKPKRTEYSPDTHVASTVLHYSDDIKQRIAKALASYGQKSQSLDQSFPQRLLTVSNNLLAPSELKPRMAALDKKREEFKEIGLLDETPAHPFDLSKLDILDDTQKRVLTLYVQDTEQKLGVLDDIASRAKLLLDNINHKFNNKKLYIDREKGFIARGENGQDLDMDALSSGEQHEIVLLYDLLFRVEPNTLVLIDEPELSLHVAWQERFLPDLLRIVKLAEIDVLIATHSPYIVGERTDLMVALETGTSHA
jgi:predicted ATP-binding protein involved in virulence